MGHAGTSRKSTNDAPWEMLSLRLSRPFSAPLLTAVLSWRYEEKNMRKTILCEKPCCSEPAFSEVGFGQYFMTVQFVTEYWPSINVKGWLERNACKGETVAGEKRLG